MSEREILEIHGVRRLQKVDTHVHDTTQDVRIEDGHDSTVRLLLSACGFGVRMSPVAARYLAACLTAAADRAESDT